VTVVTVVKMPPRAFLVQKRKMAIAFIINAAVKIERTSR
jgi:hypothetical protein